MALLTLAGVGSTTASNFIRVARDRDVYRAVASGEGARGRSLVLMPSYQGFWVLHPFAGLRNDLELEQKTIYAVNRGSKNLALAFNYPDRDLYQLKLVGSPGPGRTVDLLRSRVISAGSYNADLKIVNTSGRRYVAVQVIRGTSLQWALIDTESTRGRAYNLSFTLSAVGATGLPWERGVFRNKEYPLAVAVYFSTTADFANRRAVEQRFWYRVKREADLQLLIPGETFRGRGSSRRMRWELVEKDRALQLSIRPRPV